MTKEEAIKSALKFLVRKQQEQGSWGYADNNDNEISWNEVIRWVDQQPCGYCIFKQAIIDTIETDCSWTMFDEWGNRTPIGECINEAIKRMPSVESERKPGKWIEHRWAEEENGLLIPNWECSLCGMWERKTSDYCPNCGAKMEAEV